MVQVIKKFISAGKQVFFMKHEADSSDSVIVYNSENALKFSFLSRPVSSTWDHRIKILEIVSSIRSLSSKNTPSNTIDIEITKNVVLEQLRYCKKYEHLNVTFSVTLELSSLLDSAFLSKLLNNTSSNIIISMRHKNTSFSKSELTQLDSAMLSLRQQGVQFCLENFLTDETIDFDSLNYYDWDYIKISRTYFLNNISDKDLRDLTRLLLNGKCKLIIDGIDKVLHCITTKMSNSLIQGNVIGLPMKIDDSIYYYEKPYTTI
ncbi:EAL domain-containing protein [Vibrio scophthalmi]|uniref:EAL domain-containing protein n=1 Tax=Vibrio scophthalmi TaxID=45658 RepID=UPI003872C94B